MISVKLFGDLLFLILIGGGLGAFAPTAYALLNHAFTKPVAGIMLALAVFVFASLLAYEGTHEVITLIRPFVPAFYLNQ